MKKKICTICARGGSKGVKNKNVRIVAGMPLIAHTIKAAQQSNLFDEIAVSSDSEEILNIAKSFGVKHLVERPEEMATDTAAKLPAIRHAVQTVEKKLNMQFDICVDLDATSPLRDVEDIVGSIKLLDTEDCSNVITGASARRSPYFNLVEVSDDGYVTLSKKLDKPIVRRQDAPRCYDMNASIYVWHRDVLMSSDKVLIEKTKIFEMPEQRSLDIDSELDFDFVKFLLEKKYATQK